MKFRALIGFLLVFAFFITGCGSLPATPTPTPTATPPPTATSTAAPSPSATRPNPTATKANTLPPAIAFSLNKTQSAHSIKYNYAQELTLVQNGKTSTIPMLTVSGADSTLNRETTISGTTSDTNEFVTYQVIVIGADAYVKGITGIPGVDPTKWYQLPEGAQTGVRRLPSALGLIASFSPDDVAKAQFQSNGSETLEDQTCTVWSAQNPQFAQTLIGLAEGSELRKQIGEIDKTELKLLTCADGYIHQIFGQVSGRSAKNAADTVTLTLRFEMSNFDEALKIEPPAEVSPFPSAPPEGQATPAAGTTESATPAVGETESATPAVTGTPETTKTPTP